MEYSDVVKAVKQHIRDWE